MPPRSAQSFAEVSQRLVGYEKLGIGRPTKGLFGQSNLVNTQRRAVGRCCVLFVGAAVGNVGAADDDGWPPGLGPRLADGIGHGDTVVPIHSLHVPAVSLEPLARILVVGQGGIPLNGDLVVVVEIEQLAQAQVSGE